MFPPNNLRPGTSALLAIVHVAVTVKNGVVNLPGMVFDPQDMQDVRRIIRRRISGVKCVVNELEICNSYGGGGG